MSLTFTQSVLSYAAAHHSVIVAEAAPYLQGHALATALSRAGIETTVIPDAAVFAIMARVNKVLMPTHAVVANGGLVAACGSHLVALAASELSVPVVCVTGLYKLCPLFPHDQDTFNCLLAPSAVMQYEDSDSMPGGVEVLNPAYDYIPPELVDLYITNIGGHQPSYIYRLLAEYYHRDDYILAPEYEG
jgi:translation initiation factor eIF-2B subunit beta